MRVAMMDSRYFDRSQMRYFPLSERYSKVEIVKEVIDPESYNRPIPQEVVQRTKEVALQIVRARKNESSVIMAFGAHSIKNGLGSLLGDMMKRGWITHLATNGAGVIHDWEFSYLGRSSEDVKANVQKGRFGTWRETGFFINLALAVGSYRNLGYGESIGAFISNDGIDIPSKKELGSAITSSLESKHRFEIISAAADLLELIDRFELEEGFLSVAHPFSFYSAQSAAYKLGLPFTSHPMFGHDIIYTHDANKGSVIGRVAQRDFLSFAQSVSNLEKGVYLSVGSAVMSPMIFEKSLSMARNVSLQHEGDIRDFDIHVVDLQPSSWDWSKGEPPSSSAEYYLRFMKTFNRMGRRVSYLSADNRDFLVSLYRDLDELEKAVK